MSNLIRAALPQEVHAQLKHLAIDLGKPVQALLVHAAVLLLRHHGRATDLGVPDNPRDPTHSSATKGGGR